MYINFIVYCFCKVIMVKCNKNVKYQFKPVSLLSSLNPISLTKQISYPSGDNRIVTITSAFPSVFKTIGSVRIYELDYLNTL